MELGALDQLKKSFYLILRTIQNILMTCWLSVALWATCYLSLVMRKPAFCICENKDADQLHGYREADQRLCFALRIVQFLYYLNPKFQASSHLLWLYSRVRVGPGRKPRRPVFSQRGSFNCLPLQYWLLSSVEFCYRI